jgi:hypothetical protein
MCRSGQANYCNDYEHKKTRDLNDEYSRRSFFIYCRKIKPKFYKQNFDKHQQREKRARQAAQRTFQIPSAVAMS